MNPQLTASRQFVSDLVQSGAVLLQRPALPILTLGLALATEVPSLWRSPHDWWAGLIFLAANVVMAGWVGTQRIWYLRAFRGGDIRPIELISLTGSFIPRFVILGVLITIPNAAVLPLLAWVVHNPRTLLTAWLVVPLVVSVTTDVLLTFVTPALAYSTRHVGRGLSSWPATPPARVAPLCLVRPCPASCPHYRDAAPASIGALSSRECNRGDCWIHGRPLAQGCHRCLLPPYPCRRRQRIGLRPNAVELLLRRGPAAHW